MFADDKEHFGRCEVSEAGPAQVVVRASARVGAFGEDATRHGAVEAGGLALFQGLQVIQAADEQQVGDLFDNLQRVGDTAGPETIPDAIDLAANFAG